MALLESTAMGGRQGHKATLGDYSSAIPIFWRTVCDAVSRMWGDDVFVTECPRLSRETVSPEPTSILIGKEESREHSK